MITTLRGPYDERDSANTRWVIIFVLLSLLAHALLIAVILIITRFMPVPKFTVPKEPPAVTLTIVQPPPMTKPKPQKPIFIPTTKQPDAVHKQQIVESANDTELTSRSKVARKPDSILPDTLGKPHAPNLVSAPEIRAPEAPQVSSTPPVAKQSTPQKPTPPQPEPQHGESQPTPTPKPQVKTTPPKKATPGVDPITGLPVLPPIAAQTMAPPNQVAQPLAPAPSQQQTAAAVPGAMSRRAADSSPAAMATELGKYKQYVYSVVGSYWYPDINQHFGLIPVGAVHIQFTIHSDGTLSDVTILEGDNQDMLKTISQQALVKPAPFKPFSDAMIKEVGDSYTDDFTFSVY
jgi:outer membrane biosynthesis protein TonB